MSANTNTTDECLAVVPKDVVPQLWAKRAQRVQYPILSNRHDDAELGRVFGGPGVYHRASDGVGRAHAICSCVVIGPPLEEGCGQDRGEEQRSAHPPDNLLHKTAAPLFMAYRPIKHGIALPSMQAA